MTTPAPQQYPFETRPLTEPVDPRAVAQFARQMRAQHPSSTSQIVVWIILGVVAVFFVLPAIGAMVAAIVAATTWNREAGFALSVPMFIPLVIAAIAVPIVIASMRRARENSYRIARFAAANGMTYRHIVNDPPLPGMIFHQGHSRRSAQLVRGQQPRFVEFGNFQYTTGSGKNKSTHNWGYVAVKLDVPLPNIVLDALGNNALGSNLPSSFDRDQRLSLEGDFDKYFTLYCPRGYEADALYLFTPDIMARFIDHAAQLDVEIVDDWMFLYMQRPASTTDPATWAWLFGTVGALMSKFDQWARWRDDRLRAVQAAPQHPVSPSPATQPAGAPTLPVAPPVGLLAPPPGVALPGRRLRKGFSWITLVIVLAVFGLTLLPQLIGILAFLFSR